MKVNEAISFLRIGNPLLFCKKIVKRKSKMKKLILLLMVSVLFIHADFTVSYAGGKNFLLRNEVKMRLRTTAKLKATDTVVTGPKSFVAIRSDDGSVYKVLANTTISLDSYANDEVERKASFTLGKGKIFSFVSKTFKKSDVKFYTSNGVVGVRGTSFLLDNSDDNLKVYLTEGSVAIYETDNVSTPVGVISAGQVAEKAGGEALVKVTPLTQSQLDQATQEIPTSVQELNDNFDNSDALDGEEVSVDAELTEGDADAIAASDLDETSKEENISISEEINVANQETEELRLMINETMREIDESIQRNRQEIRDREDAGEKTLNGYKITQTYSKENNTITIGSTSVKNGLMNTFSLALTYGKGISADSFRANSPPSGLTSSVLSIMGQMVSDGSTWGITYYNDFSGTGTRIYDIKSINSATPSRYDETNLAAQTTFLSYNDTPQEVYDYIFPLSINIEAMPPIDITYAALSNNEQPINPNHERDLFNLIYPNVEGVPDNRNVVVQLSQSNHPTSQGSLFSNNQLTEVYYFTDGFGDYLAPLFDNPVTGNTLNSLTK